MDSNVLCSKFIEDIRESIIFNVDKRRINNIQAPMLKNSITLVHHCDRPMIKSMLKVLGREHLALKIENNMVYWLPALDAEEMGKFT